MILPCILVVGLSCIDNSTGIDQSAAEPLYDCLPLHSGLRYIYDYQLTSVNRIQMGLRSITTDSGTVEYTILDSLRTVNGTLLWSVLENVHLLRRYWSAFSGSQIPDTTYMIDSSTPSTLSEGTSGSHELQMASRVWLFPLRENRLPMTDSVTVMRYSRSPSRFLTLTLLDSTRSLSGLDTMWFDVSRGLTRFYSTSNAGSSHTGYAHTLIAQLLLPTTK